MTLTLCHASLLAHFLKEKTTTVSEQLMLFCQVFNIRDSSSANFLAGIDFVEFSGLYFGGHGFKDLNQAVNIDSRKTDK